MVLYKQNGQSFFGYRTADGEIVTSYEGEAETVDGEEVVTYHYTVNGVEKTSSVEPVAVELDVSDDSNRIADLMDDDMLDIRFSLAEYVNFPLGCYTVFGGRNYYLFKVPEITKQHNRQFDYTMPMYTAEYLLHTTMMRNVVTNYSTTPATVGGDFRLKFPFTAHPAEHVQMIADCLNLVDSGWTVVVNADVENKEKLVSYEFVYCDEALRSIAETYDTEYEIVGKCITLGKVEHNKETPLSMSYGKGNGFKSGVARRNESDMPPVDRLYIQGGEQNIPEHYGQTEDTSTTPSTWSGEKSSTLLLPKNVACLYDGGHFYFITNPTILTANGKRYIKAKDLSETGEGGRTHIPDVIMDDDGEVIDYYLRIGMPCFLTSNDGRSLERVRYAHHSSEVQNGLDDGYVPRNSNVEAVYDASEVYPMRVGGVSRVDEVNGGTDDDGTPIKFYDIYDAAPDCPNYRDCNINGETMTIIFQDGMLAGREFDLNTYDSGQYKDLPVCESVTVSGVSCKRMELCQAEQDGMPMPGGSFIPKYGDHYIVFHCSLPQEYISGIAYGAEYRALREAVNYLYHHGKATYTFSGAVDTLWVNRVWDEYVEEYAQRSTPINILHSAYFNLGQHIKVKDVQLFGAQGLVMRVTGIKQPINKPHAMELTLTNALTLKFNWVSQLTQTVRDVRVRPPHLRPNQYAFPRNLLGLRQADISPDSERRGRWARMLGIASVSRVDLLDLAEMQDRAKVNDVIDSLTQTNSYFQQCRNAIQDIRAALADSTTWEDLKQVVYRDLNNYIHGISEIGSGGSCTPEHGCSMSVVDIEVPSKLSVS